MKKAIIMFLVLMLAVPACSVSTSAAFSDIPSDNEVLGEAARALIEQGITKGISDTEFGANQNVTREQMSAFIYRMANHGESPEGGANMTAFTDLDDPTFYAMISWAADEGIIKGISDTAFNPKGDIILQDCYTMLTRALGYEKDGALSYPDEYIQIAEEIGLNQNISTDKTYTDTLTRGDVALIIYNVLNLKSHKLAGKKIIFIGNSFTYYGKTVIDAWNNVDDEVMTTRFDDKGYFYQLCKQNGADVTVTNWTWGGHTLGDTFGGSCSADRGHDGHDHLADLKRLSDMNYDYVVIQPGSGDTAETATASIKQIQELFRAVNPDVKFLYAIHPRYYLRGTDNDQALLDATADIESDLSVTVADWGNIISDIISGTAAVENATQTYNQNTFIISKSATDGYHPNMLTGYITTQMIYSIITGEKAEGVDYSFCTDETIHPKFSVDEFLSKYYTYDNISEEGSEAAITGDELTSFPEVFKSPSDMASIQKLIDKYIAEKPYRNR